MAPGIDEILSYSIELEYYKLVHDRNGKQKQKFPFLFPKFSVSETETAEKLIFDYFSFLPLSTF